jgi:hypothetical protein
VKIPEITKIETEVVAVKAEINLPISEEISKLDENMVEIAQPKPQNLQTFANVSALSLSSIRVKKELLEAQKGFIKEEIVLPTEAFTENQMLEYWYKYADRLGEKGHRIMESLLRINNPKLQSTTIIHEMPNDGSKIDFEREKHELLVFLRSHLHNHEISIEIIVNEKLENKFAFTDADKYNRLREINPNLELLKKTFDLDF